jgi:hypothetical protein
MPYSASFELSDAGLDRSLWSNFELQVQHGVRITAALCLLAIFGGIALVHLPLACLPPFLNTMDDDVDMAANSVKAPLPEDGFPFPGAVGIDGKHEVTYMDV